MTGRRVMREKLKSGDEIDAIWARNVLKCFSNHARAKRVKRIIHKRRRRVAKLEIRAEQGEG